MMKYFTTYDGKRFGTFETLEEAYKAIKNHPNFFKSKYTRKGSPRSNYKELKRFFLSDNNGDMYYIY